MASEIALNIHSCFVKRTYQKIQSGILPRCLSEISEIFKKNKIFPRDFINKSVQAFFGEVIYILFLCYKDFHDLLGISCRYSIRDFSRYSTRIYLESLLRELLQEFNVDFLQESLRNVSKHSLDNSSRNFFRNPSKNSSRNILLTMSSGTFGFFFWSLFEELIQEIQESVLQESLKKFFQRFFLKFILGFHKNFFSDFNLLINSLGAFLK